MCGRWFSKREPRIGRNFLKGETFLSTESWKLFDTFLHLSIQNPIILMLTPENVTLVDI